MKYSEWKIPRAPAKIPEALAGAGCTPLLAALLQSRGFESAEQASAFLDGGAENLCDPFLLADMDRAAARVRQAIDRRETVAVFGDYDVDGITAACLISDYLISKGLDCQTYIPDRIEEGYGLNLAAVDAIAKSGVKLIITVDCGITAAEEAARAKSLGVDMVITDHHECGASERPEAVAVVDPKRPDCGYPNQDLAGVGVAFKLLCAVEGDAEKILSDYSDMVATGTVADVMPLVGENRYIVRRGLKKLAESPRPGIRALLTEAGAEGKRLTAMTIGFTLAPRINAAGRLGQAGVAVELLRTNSPAKAAALAIELCRLNRERQALEQSIFEQTHEILEKAPPKYPIVLASEGWHQGVIGIAASKLAEEYSLPTVMICLDGDVGKGSCRSCGDFNLFDALSACSEYLEGFGGHALAAGLSIRRDRVDEFRSALAEYYIEHPGSGAAALICDLRVDDPELLDMEGVASLERMEPFGSGNPRPVLCIVDALLERVTPIGAGRHLRLNIKKCGRSFECVLFSRTEEELGVRAGDRIDAAFFPQINDFRSRRSVQLLITDVRKTDLTVLCRRILEPGAAPPWGVTEFCPNRQDFARSWRRLVTLGGALSGELEELADWTPEEMHIARFSVCLRIMAEAGLLTISVDDERVSLKLRNGDSGEKADLESVAYYKTIRGFRRR